MFGFRPLLGPSEITLIVILEHHPTEFTLLEHPESSNHPPALELSELQKIICNCLPGAAKIPPDQNPEHLIFPRQLEAPVVHRPTSPKTHEKWSPLHA